MAMSLADLEAKFPVDPEKVEAAKASMMSRVRAHRLRELREAAGLTQEQLAQRIGVGQRQVSKIESGDLDNAKIGTVRKYLAAVNGEDNLALGILTDESFVRVA